MSRPNYINRMERMEANDPSARSLSINDKDEFDFVRLGNALGRNTQVDSLNLHLRDDSIPSQKLEAFCRGLAKNTSINNLCLDRGSLTQFYRSILKSGISAKILHFNEGWETDLDPELCELIVNMPNVYDVNWNVPPEPYDDSNTVSGLPILLDNKQSNLSGMHLHISIFIADDVISLLANCLERNQKLIDVCLTIYDPEKLFSDFNSLNWIPMRQTLCLHNNTLEEIWGIGDETMPKQLQSLLEMNKSRDKEHLRIRKGLDYNFMAPERGIKCEPLENEFDLKLLPHLLASIGTVRHSSDRRSKNDRRSALYFFVKNKPMLVVSSGCQNKRKRKVGSIQSGEDDQ